MVSKVIVLFIGLLAVTHSQDASFNPKDAIELRLLNVLEIFRDFMTTGYPDLGIPPLDPFYIDQFSYTLDESTLRVNFQANNIKISNARNFLIQNVSFSKNPVGASFELLFPNISITADQYAMNGRMMFFFPIKNSGKMSINLIGVKVRGLILVSLLNGATPYLEDIVIDVEVGDVEANLENAPPMVNRLIASQGAGLINNQKASFTDAIRQQLMPPVNEFLSQLTFQDIVNRI